MVVLGPHSVGKSQLCDVVLSVASGHASPTYTRLFSTQREKVIETPECMNVQGTRRIDIEDSTIGPVCLMDIHTPEDVELSSFRSAINSADVVIWCTQSFSPPEAELWSHATDTLKDHSFLVLTQADALAKSGDLSRQINALQKVSSEEFHSLYVTATAEAAIALKSGNPAFEELCALGGVRALKDALRTLIFEGCRVDQDNAMLFLDRHGVVAASASGNLTEATAGPERNSQFTLAKQNLMERSLDLAELAFDESAGDMTNVLACCESIAEELVETVGMVGHQVELPEVWKASFDDAADKIVLMATENDERSAADAATILLQMRRDLSALSTL